MELDKTVLVLKTTLEARPRKVHTKGSDYFSLFYYIHHSFPPHSLNGTFTDSFLVNLHETLIQDGQQT